MLHQALFCSCILRGSKQPIPIWASSSNVILILYYDRSLQSIQSFILLTISSRHRLPYFFIAHITTHPLTNETSPMIVHIQPFPMASIKGAATTPPTHEKMFRIKLLTAIPVEARFGMNSVSMVVAMAKMSMDPTPKKKFATAWNCQ